MALRPYQAHRFFQLLWLLAGACWWALAAAQIPHKINYQGFLTDTNGTAVDGTVSMTLKLYSVVSGGVALYTETQAVTVTQGTFNVLVGSVTPLPLPFDVPYFLGITVASDTEMAPRQAVAASAYAIRSASAETLIPTATIAGSQISGSISTGTLPGPNVTGTIGTSQIANGAVTQAKLSAAGAAAGRVLATDGANLLWQTPAGGTVTSVATGAGLTGGPITGSGTIGLATTQKLPTVECSANYIPKWVVGAWVCSPDQDTNNAANDLRYFKQGGNAFAAAALLGTTDSQPLHLLAGGLRALRIQPDSVSPVFIAGSPGNFVAFFVYGAAIGGGGAGGSLLPSGASCNGSCVNRVSDTFGTVGGGAANQAGDNSGSALDQPFATVGGGFRNTSSGGSATVGGGEANVAAGFISTVAGGNGNQASGLASTVSGGKLNVAGGQSSSVGGGDSNSALASYATVSGGLLNSANGAGSTVSGGGIHCPSPECLVSLQSANTALGSAATVPGGYGNRAGGDYSFAAGRFAVVRDAATVGGGDTNGDEGTFVWSDASGSAFTSSGPNQFLVRASGGVGINTNAPEASSLHVHKGSAGAVTAHANSVFVAENGTHAFINVLSPADAEGGVLFGRPGNAQHGGIVYGQTSGQMQLRTGGNFARVRIENDGKVSFNRPSTTLPFQVGTDATNGNGAHLTVDGVWTNGSSRTFKEGFAVVDTRAVLAKVAALPIVTWRYRGADAASHIGPMAEDFHAAFGLGQDPRYIGTVDADGVALAAIQGLHQLVREKDARLDAQQHDITTLRNRLSQLDSLRDELVAMKAMIARMTEVTLAAESR